MAKLSNFQVDEIVDLLTIIDDYKNDDYIMKEVGPWLRSSVIEFKQDTNSSSFRDALKAFLFSSIKQYYDIDKMNSLAKEIVKFRMEPLLDIIHDENVRLKYAKRMREPAVKAKLVSTLHNDELKIKYLMSLPKEKDRLCLVASFDSDELKLGMLDDFNEYSRATIIASLSSDDEKKRLLLSGKVVHTRIADVLCSFKDDSEKSKLLQLVSSDTARARVIISIQDIELKKKLFDSEIRDSDVKRRKWNDFVLSLPKSEQFSFFYDVDENGKIEILKECDIDTVLSFLDTIESTNGKKKVLSVFGENELLEYFYALKNGVLDNSEFERLQLSKNEIEEMKKRRALDILMYGSINFPDKLKALQDFFEYTEENKEIIRMVLRNEKITDVLQGYFDVQTEAIPVDKFDMLCEIYSPNELANLVFEIPDYYDLFVDSNVRKIREIMNIRGTRFLFPRNIKFDRLKILDNLFKDNYTKISHLNASENYYHLDELKEVDFEAVEELLKKYKSVYPNVYVDSVRYFDTKDYLKVSEETGDICDIKGFEALKPHRSELMNAMLDYGLGNMLINSLGVVEKTNASRNKKDEIMRVLTSFICRDAEETEYSTRFGITHMNKEILKLLEKYDEKNSVIRDATSRYSTKMTKKTFESVMQAAAEVGVISKKFAISSIVSRYCPKLSGLGIDTATELMLDLFDEQNIDFTSVDKFYLAEGSFSKVFVVGDYVVKVGDNRVTPKLSLNECVLNSVARFSISDKNSSNNTSAFIEVQPKIEKNGKELAESGENISLLQGMYNSLRENHVVWGDAEFRNIGYYEPEKFRNQASLLKDFKNKLDKNDDVVIYHPRIPREDSRMEPRWVIIDTDFLYDSNERESAIYFPSAHSEEFEKEYQKALEHNRLDQLLAESRSVMADISHKNKGAPKKEAHKKENSEYDHS